MPPDATWQPIETAPKDARWVLLTGGRIDYGWDRDETPACVVGQFIPAGNSPSGCWQFAWYDGGYYGEYEKPTHWMPLPEPPAPEKQQDSATPWREGMTWQEAMVEAHALAGKIPSQSVMDGAAMADRRGVRVSRETFNGLVAIQMRSITAG